MNLDQWLLIALKFVRMAAYGLTTIVLVPFLLEAGSTSPEVGLFMTLTLLGDVVLSTYITYVADNIGRRFMLGLSAVLMILSGVCFMFSTNFWVLLAAAIFGVISPSGDEVGPFRSIEESTIAHITPYEHRANLFAMQNLVGTLGLALGSLLGGWIAEQFTAKTGKELDAYRVVFFCYVVCAIAALLIAANLSGDTEMTESVAEAVAEDAEDAAVDSEARNEVSLNVDAAPQGAKLTFALCLLFGIDSLAYGFMSNSWLVEYMLETFKTSIAIVGVFFFVSTFISAMTSFPSAWFTDRVGPVLAISLTKLGAGAFGALVPVATHELSAMVLVWLRSLFDTMDVVPRQVFITSIVPPGERTRTLGLVNVVKTLARAIGPSFTGVLATHGHLRSCFVIMGGLELVFAAVIYGVFKDVMPQLGQIEI